MVLPWQVVHCAGKGGVSLPWDSSASQSLLHPIILTQQAEREREGERALSGIGKEAGLVSEHERRVTPRRPPSCEDPSTVDDRPPELTGHRHGHGTAEVLWFRECGCTGIEIEVGALRQQVPFEGGAQRWRT